MKTTVNGISVNYSLEGPAGAPVVTMSHSLATDLSMWDPTVPALTSRFRVLRYVLGMADMPLMILPVPLDGEIPVEIGGVPAAGRLVVLSTETTRGRTAGGLRALGLRSLDGQPVAPPRSAPGFAGYRVEATQRRSPAP